MSATQGDRTSSANPNNKRGRAMAELITPIQNQTQAAYKKIASWTDKSTNTEKSDTGFFKAPVSGDFLIDFLQTLSAKTDDSKDHVWNDDTNTLESMTLDYAFGCFMQGLDARIGAKLRPSPVVESTAIFIKKVKIDLLTGERTKDGAADGWLSLEKRVGAVNNGFEQAENLGGQPGVAFINTRRKMVEDGLATLQGNKLVVNPEAARKDAAAIAAKVKNGSKK